MTNLKTIMFANAASCIGFGATFALFPSAVAGFLSASPAPSWLLLGLGVMLIGNGILLIWLGMQQLPRTEAVVFFSLGDFAWVLATLALIALGIWITTTAGIIAALAVAAMVGYFGVAQMVARKKLGSC